MVQARDRGYDLNVNEIGQKTWGLMKGVMAIASQKVEELAKEGTITWQQPDNNTNGYHPEINDNQSSTSLWQNNSTSSWDDWGANDEFKKKPISRGAGDSWGGWDDDDDAKDDHDDDKHNKQIGKPASAWSDGGFQ